MDSEKQRFLQTIIRYPEDDAPRLIYADWLEEHDEVEFATFIRTQIELANLPEPEFKTIGSLLPDDKRFYRHGMCTRCEIDNRCRYHSLDERQKELVNPNGKPRNHKEWWPEFPGGWALKLDNFNYASLSGRFAIVCRGFVERLVTDWHGCEYGLDTTITRAPIREITLTDRPDFGTGIQHREDIRPSYVVAGKRIEVPIDLFYLAQNDLGFDWYAAVLELRWPGIKFKIARPSIYQRDYQNVSDNFTADGNISACRFVVAGEQEHHVRQANGWPTERIFGISMQGNRYAPGTPFDHGFCATDGDDVMVYTEGADIMLELGGVAEAGSRLGPDSEGRGIQPLAGRPHSAVALEAGVPGQRIRVRSVGIDRLPDSLYGFPIIIEDGEVEIAEDLQPNDPISVDENGRARRARPGETPVGFAALRGRAGSRINIRFR